MATNHSTIDPNHPALQGSLTPPSNCPASKVYNFSPGPTSLPAIVESTIAHRCFPHPSSLHLGSMALSHRSPEFTSILSSAASNLRRVMQIPPEYEVLFAQGGGHGQFAAVPMNLCPTPDCIATYIVSGTWSTRAVDEASKYCRPHVIDGRDANGHFVSFPLERMDEYHPDSKFIYLCSNETVNGIELHRLPVMTSDMPPLVVDASSDFTTKPISWRQSNIGILFACASKNIGHAGLTAVIARRDLVFDDNANPLTPGFLNYRTNIEAGNVWNTIPTFNVDVVNIMMEWILEKGGIHVMEKMSIEKANAVYGVIDNSGGFYGTPLSSKEFRSRMNVPFCVSGGDEELTNVFLVECWKRGIVGLRTVTPFKQGIYLRASLYHGVSHQDVVVLVDFMKEFAALYGGVDRSSTAVEEKKGLVGKADEVELEPLSPSSSIVDLSRLSLSSSPTGVADMALTVPKNFKISRYTKLSGDMFAPPSTLHNETTAAVIR